MPNGDFSWRYLAVQGGKQLYNLCQRETTVQSVSARNNCAICVCVKQLYNLCLRETIVQSVSTWNNCTVCVCKKQLYGLCLQETTVQSVFAWNSCTVCVCMKQLYNLCLRETTVQSMSAWNSCTIFVCVKQLYSPCLHETTVQSVSARNNYVCVCVALPRAIVTGNFSQNSCSIHTLAHQLILTPLSTAVREKLTVSHTIRNSAFYGTRRFIIVFTRPRQVYWFCARSIPRTLILL